MILPTNYVSLLRISVVTVNECDKIIAILRNLAIPNVDLYAPYNF